MFFSKIESKKMQSELVQTRIQISTLKIFVFWKLIIQECVNKHILMDERKKNQHEEFDHAVICWMKTKRILHPLD